MNVIKELTDRITDRMTETKNPCKSFKTEAAAEKAAEKMARIGADHFRAQQPANYVVFLHPKLARWVAAFDINELVRREETTGGYVGIFAAKDFYSY